MISNNVAFCKRVFRGLTLTLDWSKPLGYLRVGYRDGEQQMQMHRLARAFAPRLYDKDSN